MDSDYIRNCFVLITYLQSGENIPSYLATSWDKRKDDISSAKIILFIFSIFIELLVHTRRLLSSNCMLIIECKLMNKIYLDPVFEKFEVCDDKDSRQ